MGRPKRYRERIQFEMHSVRAKSVRALVTRTLQTDFGRSRIEAIALADRSLQWLRSLGISLSPGQVRLSVPATAARRYARERRILAVITAVDVAEDTEIWQSYGLGALQCRRLLRWLYEIYHQGGWASLAELAAWANLTPTALAARLKPTRELGIWLPHVGRGAPQPEALALEPWLVNRFLQGEPVEEIRARLGITTGVWEAILRRFVRLLEGFQAGGNPDELAASLGLSPLEAQQFLALPQCYRQKARLRELRDSYGTPSPNAVNSAAGIEAELVSSYGFSPATAQLYRRWLEELAGKITGTQLAEGELLYFAIAGDEGARACLEEARHVPVRLHYFTADDAEAGPYGASRTRVANLKFGRIRRYATEARAQGALLTLPDLAILLGMHVDAIRRKLAAHPEVAVPTRGRVQDIGRGVTHKTQIVELYLQMHTETEIVERTGHTYESVERYLRDFARVVTLADQGMNPVMIRRVTGRSLTLVKAYLELYHRYDQPDYHFRLSQLRNVFTREDLGEKGGRVFRFHTGGVER